jgi:hypothetical protein
MHPKIVSEANVGHDHSYLGTLRGLFLYGRLTRQHPYVDAVAATYRRALPTHVITESGWAPHDLGKRRFANEHGDPVADPASAGDAAQLALWLALDAGHLDLLNDVERLVRARLLPGQVTEKDAQANPDAEIGSKLLGGWGIHNLPHATKSCVLDVTAAVLHTLTDVYQRIVERTPAGLAVNLHLDYEGPAVQILTEREQAARLILRVRSRENVLLRVPGWVPTESVRLTVDDCRVPVKLIGPFAYLPRDLLREDSTVVLQHGLPARETRERMPSGQVYRFAWRGDEISGVRPNPGPLPFYPSL